MPAPAARNESLADARPRERVFTPALLVFLAAVAVYVGLGVRAKYPKPGVDGAVRLLADGDLDGDERRRMLRRTVDGALASEAVAHRWAGLLAAVALEDRAAYAQLLAALGAGEVPSQVPAEAERELLDLGDPLLGNLLHAMIAETAHDHEGSLKLWRRTAVQSRLSGNAFAAELATAGIRRLT
jgi:hypothetical protein